MIRGELVHHVCLLTGPMQHIWHTCSGQWVCRVARTCQLHVFMVWLCSAHLQLCSSSDAIRSAVGFQLHKPAAAVARAWHSAPVSLVNLALACRLAASLFALQLPLCATPVEAPKQTGEANCCTRWARRRAERWDTHTFDSGYRTATERLMKAGRLSIRS